MRAYVLTRLGRHDEALDTLQPLTEWDHYFSGTLLALVHYNLGNYREAEETCCLPLYELQIRIDSGFGQYSGLNRQPGIDVDLKLNPDNVKAIRDCQKLHSDFGELEKALQDLLRARELSDTKQRSSTISYYYLMGQHDQLAEEASLLIADLEQSAAQDKEKRQATAHSYRAGAYTATGQYEQAAKDYVEVLSIIRSMEEQGVDTQYLRSRGYRANYMLGLFKIVNGDIQGGFAHLCSPDGTCDYAYAATENLFNLDAAENAHMHLYRGTAQCSVNAEEQYDCIGYHPEGRISSHTTPNHVLFDFNRALELDPTLDEARLWRAIAHSMVHGPEDPLTIQYYAEAMDLHPNDPGLLDLRAEQYAVANNFPAAIADLTSMIEIRPEKGADLHFRRATYHQQNRDKQAAEADYLKALELGYDQDKIRQAIIDLTG